MIGQPVVLRRGAKEEAEKPFWISFADLMTALMVLFLVAMSVALLAVTKRVSEGEQQRARRQTQIEQLLSQVEEAMRAFPGVSVDKQRHVIDFGDRARFETASSRLNPDQSRLLRALVPEVLAIAGNDLGRQWLKRIVVEGFTDTRGSYLYNLNLSLQRSERVICELLAAPMAGEQPLTDEELEQIRRLFLVGGYSFNSTKASLDESRRIELRIEFYGLEESRPPLDQVLPLVVGACALH
jgi:Flagellar motor protein